MHDARLHRINLALLYGIILVNLYTIGLPFAAQISYWWHTRNTSTPSVNTYIKKTAAASKPAADNMDGDRLIIPRMLINTPIIEGPVTQPYANLKKGAWRLPFSSTPDKGGNTVIAGHRFTYTEARSIFYYLDKLQIGDEIGIQWEGKTYTYHVISTEVVAPTTMSVQEATSDARLTLYTCTPLWNPKERLVVVAKPVSGGSR